MQLVVGFMLMALWMHEMSGAGIGEPCHASLQCSDTGLTCSGGKCICLMDIGRKAAETWACSQPSDCDTINNIAKKTLEISDLLVSRESVCTASSVCPNFPGTVGYCDILMAA